MLNRYKELETPQQKEIVKLTYETAKRNTAINKFKNKEIKEVCIELLKEYVYIDYENKEIIYNNQYIDEEILQDLVLEELIQKDFEKKYIKEYKKWYNEQTTKS